MRDPRSLFHPDVVTNLRRFLTLLTPSLYDFSGKYVKDERLKKMLNFPALAGFLDVGTNLGLERHDEDFGQTLGVWGVGSGPFLMLPLLGPSTPRGLAGRSVSSVLSGTFAIEENDLRIGITAIDVLETRARYLEVETLIIGDRYSFIRDSYMQYQDFESSDGKNQVDDFVDDMDDFLLD